MSVAGGLGRFVKQQARRILKWPFAQEMFHRYRGWQQSRRIEREQEEYEQRAGRMGLARDWSADETRGKLKERLSRRGIRPEPKGRYRLHIVFATMPVPWDAINIVPALRRYARVSTYFLADHGFDAWDPDWVRVRGRMNEHFVSFMKRLHSEDPVDLVMTYFSGHQAAPETIRAINEMGIVSCAFHWDDRLSFRGRREGTWWTGPVDLAGAYDLNLTQAPESLVKYRVEGGIPLLWPLAANPELCRKQDLPFRYDVSFAGSAYGNRITTIRYLQKNGIDVATFGTGWPTGFLPADKFQEIFCSSRINLNFDDIADTRYQCGKIRDFEIPMCGALMLGTHNPHLGDYFKVGEEIFTFRSKEECLEQIRLLLGDESRCARARQTARERALREHTWEHRVRFLLETIGFN